MLPEPESEIAVGSLFRVTGGALTGGVLLRVPGLQRGRMVPWFLYLSNSGGCAEKHGLSKMYLDRYCVAVSLVDLDNASLMSQVLRYYPGDRLVMEHISWVERVGTVL